MDLFVSMADYVAEWSRPVIVTLPGTRDTYADNGKLIKGQDFPPRESAAVILPLSNSELQKVDNGRYTENDRKIYTLEPYGIGAKVEYKGIDYVIDREIPQEDYTDVYRYYAKGKGPGYT